MSLGSLAPKRTLTVGSVTHGWGLASARVGWLAGYRHLIRPCAVTAALANPFIPVAGQQAALAALRQSEESFAPVRSAIAAKRRYTVERLAARFPEASIQAGGLFAWLPVGSLGMTGRKFAERLFAEAASASHPRRTVRPRRGVPRAAEFGRGRWAAAGRIKSAGGVYRRHIADPGSRFVRGSSD